MAINYVKLEEISRALEPIHRGLQRCFHTTFMIRKGKIVSIGWNSVKSHPINLKYNYTNRQGKNIGGQVGTHSEISSALRYGQEDCSDITFINLRIDMNSKLNSACPCSGCSHFLSQVGFKCIMASNKDGQFERIA